VTITDSVPPPSAEARAGLLSRVFIRWPSALVATASERPLELGDSLVPPPYDHLERVTGEFERAYAAQQGRPDRLRRALYDTYRKRFWWSSLVFLAYQTCATLGPLLILVIIDWFQSNHGGAVGEGLALAAGLGVFRVIDSVAHKHQWSETWKNTHSINALLRTQILRKYLRMDRSARLDFPSGEVVTLAASDARRVGRISFIHMAWAVPLGIAGSCVILVVLLGWPGLVGIAVLIAGLYLANVANDRLYALEPDIRQINGERMSLVTDYLGAMRTLRAHGWEDVAQGAVERKRASLNALLSRRQRRLATLYLVNAAAPVLMITVTLAVYAASGHTLKAGVVFSAIAVLTVMRSQLPELVRYLDMRNEWRVALVRVSKFLEAPDQIEQAGDEAPTKDIELAGASFAWPSAEDAQPCLTDVDLRIGAGELVAVLGRVGSGKSALLAALAGSLRAVDGTVTVPRGAIHLPQKPWIMQGTVAENIRCFAPADDERYAAVLRATALDSDLASMPRHDATPVGERGARLSGGQRQRIALARAAYEQADVYLIDDPTSAVDDAVASVIIEDLLTGLLAGSTRVVATHRLDLARRADRVVLLDGGRVVAAGTYAEVAAVAPELLTQAEAVAAKAEELEDEAPDEAETDLDEDEIDEPGRTGRVTARTYRDYLRVLTPGALVFVLFGLSLLAQGVVGASSFWLGSWTDNPGKDTTMYTVVFVALGLASVVLDRGLYTFFFWRGVKAGQTLHNSMLGRVLRAPMRFFDRNSSGRVLARFSADMETIDLELPEYAMDTLGIAVGMFVPVVALALLSVPTLVITPLIVIVYLRWQQRTRNSTVAVSRLAKQANEPMLELLAEAVEGVGSIEGRATRVDGYEAAFGKRVRTAHYADYTVNSLSRFFNLRLDLLGSVVLFGYAALLVARGGLAGGTAGAGISFAYALIDTLAMSLMTIQTTDLALASFERVFDYTKLETETEDGAPAPAGWPAAGEVSFQDVTLRYSDEGAPALAGVSFTAAAGRKTGIVGRTGSGKSSLFSALLRFVDRQDGVIAIDGVDVAGLRLRDLRSRIALIPQDPVLLPGTVRENLDPYGSLPDERLLAVLAEVGLETRISTLPGGLDAVLQSGGALSAGERQLLCLCRALLDDAKLVLIDEATANLDAETDALIQGTLARELAEATVLCIAHRRDTLADADSVVTLDAGRVANVEVAAAVLAEAAAVPEAVS